MLFDVQFALAEIIAAASATPATPATNRTNVAKVADVAAPSGELSVPATPPGGAAVFSLHGPAWPSAPGTMVRLGSERPAGRKAAPLPTHPPTCATCGVTDWKVTMTTRDGRKLHVSCWKMEASC